MIRFAADRLPNLAKYAGIPQRQRGFRPRHQRRQRRQRQQRRQRRQRRQHGLESSRLSQDRFLVKFTASRALREKLELASALMRHANPTGEIGVLLERAVDLLIAELEKMKQGRTSRPQSKPRPARDTQVTHAARREVVERDGWRCSFVAEDGRRCEAQAFLEFDHETPKGRGGSSRAENLRLLCRAHNRWAAERAYGKAHVERAISASRSLSGKPLMVRETPASDYRERSRDPNAMARWRDGAMARWVPGTPFPVMHSGTVCSP